MPFPTSANEQGISRAARIVASLTLLIAAIFTGCNSKVPTSDSPADATSAKPSAAPSIGTPAVRVAAASDLQFALKEVIAAYNEAHAGKTVEAVFGSSANLFAQLTNKAPFDMFLSADMSYPRRLIEAGLASKDSEFLYAIGHLVVWVPNDSTLDFDKHGIRALTDPSVKVIAMANPQHAPYGRVAEAALKSLGIYDAIKERLVLGENIAQTAQYVESGACKRRFDRPVACAGAGDERARPLLVGPRRCLSAIGARGHHHERSPGRRCRDRIPRLSDERRRQSDPAPIRLRVARRMNTWMPTPSG